MPESSAGPPDNPDLPFKPPVIFVVASAIGFAAHWLWPVSVRPPGWWGFGVVIIASGLTLVLWSALLFRRNDLAVVLMVIPAVAATNAWVIAREESYLARKFGEPYLEYTRRVRRWL